MDDSALISGRAMEYNHIYAFTRLARKRMGFLNKASNLLIICWELDPENYGDLTCKEVARIAKHINDKDKIEADNEVRDFYDDFDLFADRFIEMEPVYKNALKIAEALNTELDEMPSDEFMKLICGKIWTDLSDSQITTVYTYQRYLKDPSWIRESVWKITSLVCSRAEPSNCRCEPCIGRNESEKRR
ncbi:MAG: hypothetical protein Q9203_001733 [Teloschistes exilis]